MEKLKKRVKLLGTVSFSDFKPTSNPSLHLAKVRIMAINSVANKYLFTDDSVNKALPTIKNIPLVTYFNEEKNNLGDHDVCMTDGSRTYGVGSVGESCKQWIEEVEENGAIKQYLCSDVILWKRQEKEFEFIKQHKELSVSMEVMTREAYRTKDGITQVEDFYFTAITILGIGINPAFNEAVITFSEKDEQYQQMLEEIKQYESGEFSMEDNQNVNTGQTTEGQEPQSNEPTSQGEANEPTQTQGESTPNEPTQTGEEGNVVDYKAQMEQMELEYAKTIRDLKQEKETLSQQIQALTSEKDGKITSLEEELKTLRDYKNQVEKEQRETAQQEVLQRYADMKDYEGYDELMGQLDTLTAQELEDKLNLLYGRAERAKREKQRGNKPTQSKINITTTNNNSQVDNNPYNLRYGVV